MASPNPQPQQSSQIYGFLCETTNVFYALDSE